MKNFAGLVLVGYVLFNSFAAEAQSYAESALLFSRVRPGGSARIQAMGGTQVSLGGDYSSAYSNPAGLGMYNRSEFTLTLGYNSANTSSDYLQNSIGSTQSKLIVPGISLVFHSDKNKGALISGTFGITFNRINDFNRTFEYGGSNSQSSIIDYFVDDANTTSASKGGLNGDQLFYNASTKTLGPLANTPTELAYNNYLINPVSPTDQTHYATDVLSSPVLQHEKVQTTGAQNQWNFSYGLNLSDKFFLGGGIGISSINYTSVKTYSESFPKDTLLNSLVLVENLTTKGSGINATIGAIFKPMEFFQFGFSVATPTAYLLNDAYIANMTTNWSNFPYGPITNLPTQPNPTDKVLTDYNLTTPWRISGGATFFIQKHGFISADVEYVNYGGNRYSSQSTGVSFDGDNADIKSFYRPVFNLRLGGEYRINKFRVRAGYNYMPDPYKSVQYNLDNNIQSLSGGAGYRAAKFFVDLTGIFTQGKTTYGPYTTSSLVTNQSTNTRIMMTVGFPF